MVSGGMSCVKYLLFAFNLVFVIFGILLIYAGISTVLKIGHYDQLLVDAPNNAAIALIIVGFSIFVLAFLGCCGAIKENSCMLTSFSAIILVILLIELIGAGLVFAFKSKLPSVAEDSFKKLIENYDFKNNSSKTNQFLDDIQSNLKCCGAQNVADWYNVTQSDKLPYSCCADRDESNCTKEKAFDRGCVNALVDEIKSSFGLLGGIAIAVAVIQLIGIVFSCSLSRTIRKEYEVV